MNNATSREDMDGMEEAAAIDPKLDRLIGRSLEAHYADLVAAPLPDAIMVLLAKLEATEKATALAATDTNDAAESAREDKP